MKTPKLTFSIIYGVYTGLMPLIMSGLVSIWVYNNIYFFKELSPTNLVLFWLCFGLGMGLSLIPTTFVALLAGFIWGFAAIIPLIISYIFATIIGANLSKWIDNEAVLVQIERNSKAKLILAKLQNEQFKIVALARLSPVFPFGISNVIFTYLGVPLSILLYGGIIGMLPRTLLTIWAATNAKNLQSILVTNWQEYLKSPIFIIGLLSVFGILYIVNKAIRK